MKGSLASASLVTVFAATVFGQAKPNDQPKPKESEVTTVRTETKTVSAGWDLTSELWSMRDATPVREGTWDLRFTGRFDPDPALDDDEDYIIQPSIVWGVKENLELSMSVPVWLGDAGDRGGYKDGNYDTYIGSLWRFREQEGWRPALALGGEVRVPTGEGSAGIDGELRIVMTNEYDSGLRSHLNFWAKTANGDNNGSETRDFQYGGVVGVDGPLCADGAVRWVADYVYRISDLNGLGGWHFAEVGWEWQIRDNNKFGMSGIISLDHSQETSDFGLSMTYSIGLCQ